MNNETGFLTQGLAFLRRFLYGFEETLRTPQEDPRQTLMFAAIFLVIIAFLVTLTLLIYALLSRKQTGRSKISAEAKTTKQAWIARILFLAVVVITLAAGVQYTSNPLFCSYCHQNRKEEATLKKSTHRGISCMACHQHPGVSGFVVQKLDYVRWTALYLTNNFDEPFKATVDNDSCKQCHRKIDKKISSRYGIKVEHSHFMSKGSKCTDCHNTVAHGDVVPVARIPSMDKCVGCHNGQKASADCNLCHEQDIGKSARGPEAQPIKINTTPLRNCRSCHNIETQCTTCHGVEMPHPTEWGVTHGRYAFPNKQVCWRCHPSNYVRCKRCHQFPGPHGDPYKWAKEHGPIASGQVEVDIGWEDATFRGCTACHTRNVCRQCHTDNRRPMYKRKKVVITPPDIPTISPRVRSDVVPPEMIPYSDFMVGEEFRPGERYVLGPVYYYTQSGLQYADLMVTFPDAPPALRSGYLTYSKVKGAWGYVTANIPGKQQEAIESVGEE